MQRWCVEDWQFDLTVTNGKAAHFSLKAIPYNRDENGNANPNHPRPEG